MKTIKLKNNPINNESFDYLGDYLISLGIDPAHIDSFKYEPLETDRDNPNDLLNLDEGMELLHDKIVAEEHIFLQVDSDADGFTSAAIFFNFFSALYPFVNIKWRLQKGKEHGVIVDTVPDDCSLVVIPDAGTLQKEEHKELTAKGKKILILDHHDVANYEYCENVVVINNQMGNFSNRFLSGAGVVLMFIEAYNKKYFPNNLIYKNYYDLGALGIISDMMDSKTLGNNYIIYHGLRQIKNKIFQELLNKQTYSIKNIARPTKIDIAFYITPLINGLIRSGEQEEKDLFFKAMITADDTSILSSEFRGETRKETIYQCAVRQAANAKGRQDAAKRKIVESLVNKIEMQHLNQNKILIVQIEETELTKFNQNITGLAAMDISKLYNKPTLIVRHKREKDDQGNEYICYAGSGRSQEYDGLKSFLVFLRKSELIEYGEGHDNAFGVSIRKENVQLVLDYANETLKDIDFDNSVIEVDYYFKDKVNNRMLTAFGEAKPLYGNFIAEPLFAFDLNINENDFRVMGKDSCSLKIKSGVVDFVMFKAAEQIDALQTNKSSNITIVGRPQINEWMGKKTTQILIDNIEIRPAAQRKIDLRSLI